jgi:hypothetical protein
MKTQVEPSGVVPQLAFNREETARLIGQSAVTVDRLTKRGLLRPSRATRRPVYPVWEIERFLRETSLAIELQPMPEPGGAT